ncbi:hypothetical protein HDU86_001206 [Geranomyces michiganensis]|nr:hypothetical protein HDU86_001206 [Geranomyces michiganensis]
MSRMNVDACKGGRQLGVSSRLHSHFFILMSHTAALTCRQCSLPLSRRALLPFGKHLQSPPQPFALGRPLATAVATSTRKPTSSASRPTYPIARHSILGEATPHAPLSVPLGSRHAPAYDPNLVSASEADSVARFHKVAAELITTPDLVTLPDLLFLLSNRLPGAATQIDLLDALYRTLLAVPATRLVLSVLHYNHLLAHCVSPSAADDVPVPPPQAAERVAFATRVVDDMRALGIEKDAQTHAMLLLLARNHNAGDVQRVWSAIPSQLRKQLPTYAYNIMLERELTRAELSNSDLWKWHTAIQKSPAAEPSIYTYELLLRGFGPRLRNADAVVRKILPKLLASGLEWRLATFAAVLEASAVCGADEKWYNRVLYRLRLADVDVDEAILTSMLRHLLYAGKPVGVLRTYKRLAGRSKTLPTPPGHETVVTLMEACAAMPGAARPEMRAQALAEAREMLAEIITWLLDPSTASKPADDVQAELAWSYAAKCAASLHQPELVHRIAAQLKYRPVKSDSEDTTAEASAVETSAETDALSPSSTPASTQYVPRPLLLAAQALIAGRTRDANVVRAFVESEVVGVPAVVNAYYVHDAGVLDQEPFEATVYENLLLGWMEGDGGEDDAALVDAVGLEEIVELLGILRRKEKEVAERLLADRHPVVKE